MKVIFMSRCRFKTDGVYWPEIEYNSYKEAFDAILRQKKKADHAVIEICNEKGLPLKEVFYDILNKEKVLKPFHIKTYHNLEKDIQISEKEADSYHNAMMNELK